VTNVDVGVVLNDLPIESAALKIIDTIDVFSVATGEIPHRIYSVLLLRFGISDCVNATYFGDEGMRVLYEMLTVIFQTLLNNFALLLR
jgi:hypothetical protein